MLRRSNARARADESPRAGPSFRWIAAGEGPPPDARRHLGVVAREARLSTRERQRLIASAERFAPEDPRIVGQERYPRHRQGVVRKLKPDASSQWIFDLLCETAQHANDRHFGLALDSIARPPEYVEYLPDRGRFDWHNDYSHEGSFAARKLTIILQLSDPGDYEGGVLQLFDIEPIDLPAEAGSVLVFPSILFHRVTQVTSGVRRALVAWIGGPSLR